MTNGPPSESPHPQSANEGGSFKVMSTSSLTSQIVDSVYSKLSVRERIYLLIFIITFLGVIFFFVFDSWSKSKEARLQQVEALRTGIAEVRAGEAHFREIRSKSEAYQKLLKQNSIDLGKVMERHAQSEGITIDDFKEKRRILDDDLSSKAKKSEVVVAYTQEVTIRSSSLSQLSKFLEKLEKEASPVRVTSLDIRTSSQDRQELRFIKLAVTTYKLEANK